MGETITIREAAAGDRAVLEDGIAELQAFERSIDSNRLEPEAIRGKYIDHLLAECEKADGRILVAVHSGRVAGFVCVLCRADSEEIIEKEREHAYMTDLVVFESQQKAGIGTELLRAAEACARSRGATRIRVGVLAGNTQAHRLYRKLGYFDREIVLEKPIVAVARP